MCFLTRNRRVEHDPSPAPSAIGLSGKERECMRERKRERLMKTRRREGVKECEE